MFNKQFAIDVAYYSAVAAYDCQNSPVNKLILPQYYDFVGLIETQVRDDIHPVVARILKPSSIFGLILKSSSADSVLISIRGTETPGEWVDDFEFSLVPFASSPYCRVHDGFQRVYYYIRNSILTQVHQLNPKKIITIGHSLGGSLAAMTALDFILLSYQVVGYTFGEPRVGDEQFSNLFNGLDINRIVNHGDGVTDVPLPPLFKHEGVPQSVHGGSKFNDPSYAHHLTTYFNGLKGLE